MKCFEVMYNDDDLAVIWIPDDMDPQTAFSEMAGQMFGIRKSVRPPVVPFQAEKPAPATLVPWDMALTHHGDLATFTRDGTRILDEWGDCFGVDEAELRGASLITGRTDFKQLAEELKAKGPQTVAAQAG